MNAQQSKIVEEVGMRCADCKYWEAIANQEGNRKYGKCYNPIVWVEVVGDAYIKSYETDDSQFCSNFERRSA